MFERIVQKLFFLIGERPFLFCRRTDIEETAFQGFAGWNQSAGAEHDIIAQHRAIHDHCGDADETIIADGAAVYHRFVADSDAFADAQGEAAGCIGAVMRDVEYAAILYVASFANFDRMHIASDNGGRPDRNNNYAVRSRRHR